MKQYSDNKEKWRFDVYAPKFAIVRVCLEQQFQFNAEFYLKISAKITMVTI